MGRFLMGRFLMGRFLMGRFLSRRAHMMTRCVGVALAPAELQGI